MSVRILGAGRFTVGAPPRRDVMIHLPDLQTGLGKNELTMLSMKYSQFAHALSGHTVRARMLLFCVIHKVISD